MSRRCLQVWTLVIILIQNSYTGFDNIHFLRFKTLSFFRVLYSCVVMFTDRSCEVAIIGGVIISRDILTPWIRFTSDMSVTSTNLYKVRPRLPDYFLPSSLRSSARSRYALACDLPYLIDWFGNRLGRQTTRY